MQWSGRCGARRAIEAVHLRGRLERARIHGDDGVQRRTAIVVGVDAIEIVTDHLHAGGLAAIDRLVDAPHRRFIEQQRQQRGLNHARSIDGVSPPFSPSDRDDWRRSN